MKVQAFNSSRRLRLNDTTSTQTQGQASSTAYQVPLPATNNQNQDSTSALDKTSEDKPWWQQTVTLILGGLAIIGGAVALLMKSKNGDKTQKKAAENQGNTPIDTVPNSKQTKQPEEPNPIDYSAISLKKWTEKVDFSKLNDESWETGLQTNSFVDTSMLQKILEHDSNGKENRQITEFRNRNSLQSDKDFAEFRLRLLGNCIKLIYTDNLHEILIGALSLESKLILATDSDAMHNISDICRKFVEEDEVQKAIKDHKTSIEEGLSSIEKLLNFDLESSTNLFKKRIESIKSQPIPQIKTILTKEIIRIIQSNPLFEPVEEDQTHNQNLIESLNSTKTITWPSIDDHLINNYKAINDINLLTSKKLRVAHRDEIIELIKLSIEISCNPKINQDVDSSRSTSSKSNIDLTRLSTYELTLLDNYQILKSQLKIEEGTNYSFNNEGKFITI